MSDCVRAQGGGWGPPGGPPGGYPPGAPPPGGFPPGPGGFAPAPPPPGFMPPGAGGKPITGSAQTMAMHAMTIDPQTGRPRGEKPPATTAAVLSLVCGLLLCLGPLTGFTAIIAGFIALKNIREAPNAVGGKGMATAGIILGVVNLLGCAVWVFFALLGAIM